MLHGFVESGVLVWQALRRIMKKSDFLVLVCTVLDGAVMSAMDFQHLASLDYVVMGTATAMWLVWGASKIWRVS